MALSEAGDSVRRTRRADLMILMEKRCKLTVRRIISLNDSTNDILDVSVFVYHLFNITT